ncbi:MAG: DNA/RNA nuclease SfsA [Ruminococcaceae bacterium]|nr:DNA/RNA nuclease SfsA [Oscillospiraceae bacterium]
MKYPNIKEGVFVSRLNRFAAEVQIDGAVEKCHVKNTGRLRELLVPGAVCYLTEPGGSVRVTRYDLVAVKKGTGTVNIDSMAPNQVAGEYLRALYPHAEIRPETKYGDSRFDFMIKKTNGILYVEVKGVTLNRNGIALFPDAPTERGVKHIRELIACKKAGHDAMLLFVVAMQGVQKVMPNRETHAAFADALADALCAGVRLAAVDCYVTPDSLTAGKTLAVEL